MGQGLVANPGGAQGVSGQTTGQYLEPTRGGLNGTSLGGCEPPWWPEDHHKVGGVEVSAGVQGRSQPCS